MLSGLCCYDMSLSSFTRGRYQVELSGMIISTQAKPSKDFFIIAYLKQGFDRLLLDFVHHCVLSVIISDFGLLEHTSITKKIEI